MLCSSIKRPIFRSEIGILIFSPNRAAVTVIRIPRTFQKFFLAPRSVIRYSYLGAKKLNFPKGVMVHE